MTAKKTYELNFYPSERGDGIYKICSTKVQALKEYKRLQAEYPNRSGDAFIKVWHDFDGFDAEVIDEIDL